MTKPSAGGAGNQPPISEPLLVAIIDDDASVRTSTRRLVRSLGFRAEAFASGDEFLDSPMADATACLLLDVRMPGADGLEVQRCVTARYPEMPIIFISGRASEDEERRARAAGAIGFLRKPLATAMLLQIFDQLFAQEG